MLRPVNSTAQGKSGPSPNAPPLPDEDKLDAPSRQTILLLSIVCVSTLIMWAMGRVACNYHVPGESLTPRALTPEERSRTPKDAAMEFARAIEGGDFETARTLAAGSARQKLEELQKACSDCSARKQKKDALLLVGTVLADNGKEAYVTVNTERGARGNQKTLLHVEKNGKNFAIVEILEPGAKIPALPAPEPPPGLHINPVQGSKVPMFLRRPPEAAPSPAPASAPPTPASSAKPTTPATTPPATAPAATPPR